MFAGESRASLARRWPSSHEMSDGTSTNVSRLPCPRRSVTLQIMCQDFFQFSMEGNRSLGGGDDMTDRVTVSTMRLAALSVDQTV